MESGTGTFTQMTKAGDTAAPRVSQEHFEFVTAGQIIFGAGTLPQIGPAAAKLGSKAMLATGMHAEGTDRLIEILYAHGVACEQFRVPGEPSVPLVIQGVAAVKEAGCDLVIGFGGGSALDAGKAIAALATNPGSPLDYLEVVGAGKPIERPPLPFLAIPTTAGTGSEVTRNAVLSVPEKQTKVSLRSPMMLARTALVDPELTYSLPPKITAATGMDALAQVIEPYVSRRANLLTDLYCWEGITRAARALPRVYKDGQDNQARHDMAFASLMGGLSLANAGLGAVHGFAGPLGGVFEAPHGAVCAALLPAVVAINARALAEREPDNPALHRYLEIAWMVTGEPRAGIAGLTRWLEELKTTLEIPGLRAYGMLPTHFERIVEMSAGASSMKANPLTLTREEMIEILDLAL